MFQLQDGEHPPAFRMNGCGNDFIVFDARALPFSLSPQECRAIASRETGFGCDQILIIAPGGAGNDARMRVHNADGSQPEACGNGARCVALLLGEGRIGREIVLSTGERNLHCRIVADDQVCVDMGAPISGASAIPVSVPLRDGNWLDPSLFVPPMPCAANIAGAVSMGNPHAVFFLPTADALQEIDLETIGPILEKHDAFPARANISFAHIEARDVFTLRVWERGAGATLCCGTAACAAHALALRRGLCAPAARAHLPGGILHLQQRQSDGHILMTGHASLDARGLDFGEIFACAPQDSLQVA